MLPVHPKWSAYQARCASTPRRHTVEVSAPQGPQQASRLLFNAPSSVHPLDVRVQSVVGRTSFVHHAWQQPNSELGRGARVTSEVGGLCDREIETKRARKTPKKIHDGHAQMQRYLVSRPPPSSRCPRQSCLGLRSAISRASLQNCADGRLPLCGRNDSLKTQKSGR